MNDPGYTDCEISAAMRPSDVLSWPGWLLWTLQAHSVLGLTFRVIRPAIDVKLNNRIHELRYAIPEIDDSDKFCRKYYSRSWAGYPRLRRSAQEGNPELTATQLDVLFVRPYTYYAPDDVPVESINSAPWSPHGWSTREKVYGCFLDCQDIRITIEWILAIKLDIKDQVRVKSRFSMPCADGLVSEPWWKPSRREHDPGDVEALELLKDPKFHMSEQALDTDLLGDTSAEVLGCRCVKPKKDDQGNDVLPVYMQADPKNPRTGIPKAQWKPESRRPTTKEQRSKSVKRARVEWPAGLSSDQVQTHTITTCHDVQSAVPADLGSNIITGEIRRTQPEPQSQQPEYDIDFEGFIRATLSSFGGFENPDFTYEGSSSKWFDFEPDKTW